MSIFTKYCIMFTASIESYYNWKTNKNGQYLGISRTIPWNIADHTLKNINGQMYENIHYGQYLGILRTVPGNIIDHTLNITGQIPEGQFPTHLFIFKQQICFLRFSYHLSVKFKTLDVFWGLRNGCLFGWFGCWTWLERSILQFSDATTVWIIFTRLPEKINFFCMVPFVKVIF